MFRVHKATFLVLTKSNKLIVQQQRKIKNIPGRYLYFLMKDQIRDLKVSQYKANQDYIHFILNLSISSILWDRYMTYSSFVIDKRIDNWTVSYCFQYVATK